MRRLLAARLTQFTSTAAVTLLAASALSADFNPAEIARTTLPAVVAIRVQSSTGDAGGSGFIVDSSGTIITNLHVVRGATAVAVKLANGDVYDQIKVRAFDERKDLAVIQVSAFGLPTVPLGNSDALAPGQRIVVVGNALGELEGSVSTGVVSGIRTMTEGYKVVQTDATANPGNSGGPMLNEKGEVVGVVTFKIAGGGVENLNFALPINYARGLLASTESLTLVELEARLGKSADLFSKAASAFPTRWKSLSSGGTRLIRQDADHLYVESVYSEEQKQAGWFGAADLKKNGEKFVGTARNGARCEYDATDWNTLGVKQVGNRCVIENPMEIRLLTPTRIEGVVMAVPEGAKFNCKKCRFEQARVPRPFTWIPE